MVKIKEAVLVEGKYDKIHLDSFLDGVIITSGGFAELKTHENEQLMLRLASSCGLVILTDSDRAGFIIRRKLGQRLSNRPEAMIYHAYIPDVAGKEPRKDAPGKEGKLGVEGMSESVIIKALKKSGAHIYGEGKATEADINGVELLPCDLYALGITGRINSKSLRSALYRRLDLPEKLSSCSFLKILKRIPEEEFASALEDARSETGSD